MTAQPRECPSEQISANPSVIQDTFDSDPCLDAQDASAFQDWINQVKQQDQINAEFEAWANQVKTQMLKSLSKRTASC
jgi:hypothetical protein